MKQLIFLFCVVSVFCSCNEDMKDATDVALFVTPKGSEKIVVNSGEKVQYEIELHTTHNYINRVQISSFDAQYGNQILEDVLFNEAQPIYKYEYTAPVFKTDSTSVELLFKGWDDAGSSGEVMRKVEVRSRQVLSEELTGIVLTEAYNAITFADPSQPFSYTNSPDSINADLYFTADSQFKDITLQSNTTAKFVRNNSFDYASATSNSIQAVYESSHRSDNVSDLRVNDIVLVGHGTMAEGVFSVINIVREGTISERSVRLSFKKVAH